MYDVYSDKYYPENILKENFENDFKEAMLTNETIYIILENKFKSIDFGQKIIKNYLNNYKNLVLIDLFNINENVWAFTTRNK